MARVQLTMDNVYIGTYTVPAEKEGTWWHVLDIENGEVIVRNTVSDEIR